MPASLIPHSIQIHIHPLVEQSRERVKLCVRIIVRGKKFRFHCYRKSAVIDLMGIGEGNFLSHVFVSSSSQSLSQSMNHTSWVDRPGEERKLIDSTAYSITLCTHSPMLPPRSIPS